MSQLSVDSKLAELVAEDPRYRIGAYHFVFEALDFTMMRLGRTRRRGSERHLSVSELLEGIRSFALSEYGPLARIVLESMGVHDTADLGEIVFNLVDKGLLNKQEADSRAQFERHGFSFREAFDEVAIAEL